jgi:hypothetical protein
MQPMECLNRRFYGQSGQRWIDFANLKDKVGDVEAGGFSSYLLAKSGTLNSVALPKTLSLQPSISSRP